MPPAHGPPSLPSQEIRDNWHGETPLEQILSRLRVELPRMISVRVDYSMSKRVLHAMLDDVVETVEKASKDHLRDALPGLAPPPLGRASTGYLPDSYGGGSMSTSPGLTVQGSTSSEVSSAKSGRSRCTSFTRASTMSNLGMREQYNYELSIGRMSSTD